MDCAELDIHITTDLLSARDSLLALVQCLRQMQTGHQVTASYVAKMSGKQKGAARPFLITRPG
jgi:hypothetical protein